MKRRDFLSGLGATSAAIPFVARAAFASGSSSAQPTDRAIARIAIYPALGICRVGNSTEWFLAPEVPGLPPLKDGRYKDDQHKIKKQVQRFRIFAFNAANEVVREVTADDARIKWTVHVANTKAAWYGFNNPLDNGDAAPGLPSMKRNQSIIDDGRRAAMLVINPGPRSIGGRSANTGGTDPGLAMTGRFWQQIDVRLGHLQTDEAGRLLVFPGDGLSQSAVPNNPITNFSDNDGWHDDWCDGVVKAEVEFPDHPAMAAENAWVASCGPDFAPDLQPVVSLYDVMTDVNIAAGWSEAPRPPFSFRKHVYPLLRRLAQMEWVSAAHNLLWGQVGRFTEQGLLTRLSDPGAGNTAFRQEVFAHFRDPHSDETQQFKLPYMIGDGINYAGSPLRWFGLPDRQYAVLQAWAAGQFINDLGDPGQEETESLDQVPLSERPEASTRAALEPCSGGAFHPGVELTWPLRHKELFRGPFRIALATSRSADLVHNLGQLLTPDVAFNGYRGVPAAVGPQLPGDLTRWMGIPWQCDAFSCQQVSFSNDFPTAVWWPALLPVDVLPEAYYRMVMDPDVPPAERSRFVARRVAWSRGVAGIGYHAHASYTDGLNQMVSLWDQMGFVVRRDGPKDAGRPPDIPSELYVEVDRGSMDLFARPADTPGATRR